MKNQEKTQEKSKFTTGNSNAPLPGRMYEEKRTNSNDEKKGPSEDSSELERKRVEAEKEADRKQKAEQEKK